MTAEIIQIQRNIDKVVSAFEALPLDKGGEPPNDDGMEARLAKLETRLDTILPTLATKADIAEVKSDIFKWGSGFGIALTAIIIAVLSVLISRNSVPPTPTIIQMPAAPAVAPAPAPASPKTP